MTEQETETSRRQACDAIVARAAELMVEDMGAPLPMVIDRMLTFAIAQAVCIEGVEATGEAVRQMQAALDSGTFDHLDKTRGRRN
jgi:hypothetical protein